MRKILTGALLLLVVATVTTATILNFNTQRDSPTVEPQANINPASQEQAAWNRSALKSVPMRSEVVNSTQAPQAESTDKKLRIETELITVTRTGFEPTEIRRPSGVFYLQVDNRSEMKVELRLDREGRETIKAPSVDLKALEWREELNLAPGEYILSATNHPNWICHLTITTK